MIFDVMKGFQTIGIDLRYRYKLKLADAFVAATAAHWHIPLITQDKHFRKGKEGAAANPVGPGCGVSITLCK